MLTENICLIVGGVNMKYKNNNLELYKIGLGCGGMKNTDNKSENIATIHEALDSGINLLIQQIFTVLVRVKW